MSWKFDPILEELVWNEDLGNYVLDPVHIFFGTKDQDSDLGIDGGERANTGSIIEAGERFTDGNS